MTTKFHFLIAVAVSQALFLTFVAVSSEPMEGENQITGDVNYPMTLQFVGIADGKSYFAEVNQTMNRSAAAAYCHAYRLKLASIETQEQVDMLHQIMPELGFGNTYYWTSGRETGKDSMFMWNETEAQVNSSLVTYWYFYTAETSCIAFYPYNTGSTFSVLLCSNNYHPLCHT